MTAPDVHHSPAPLEPAGKSTDTPIGLRTLRALRTGIRSTRQRHPGSEADPPDLMSGQAVWPTAVDQVLQIGLSTAGAGTNGALAASTAAKINMDHENNLIAAPRTDQVGTAQTGSGAGSVRGERRSLPSSTSRTRRRPPNAR